MESVKELLENAIGSAEECRLLSNNAAGLRIHVQYIRDMIQTLIRSGYQVASADEDKNEVYAAAMKTLKNLESAAVAAKARTSLPISEVRAELVRRAGLRLSSFDGTKLNEFKDFLAGFSVVVSDDPTTSDVIKLILLKSCLKGAAFDLANVLRTSARNYRLALSLLSEVYEDRRDTRPTLFHSMVAMPPVSMSDGAEFRRAFWELESILESMKTAGVQIDDNSYLRLLYLQKFSEETLMLVKNANQSLSDIRGEIRRMVHLQELHLQFNAEKISHKLNSEYYSENPADELDTEFSAEKPSTEKPFAQNRPTEKPSGDKPSASKPKSDSRSTGAASGDAKPRKEFGGIISVAQLLNGTGDFVESLEKSGKTDGNVRYVPTLTTVCAPISYHVNGKRNITSVRILLQNLPPVSLLSEAAAKRLGINFSGQKKSLRLRGTMGGRFRATQTAFKISLDLGNGISENIKVHIVDNEFAYSGYVLPGIHVADFKKEHPHLSHLDLPDTGAGRPVDLFLSGEYWIRFLPGFDVWNPRNDIPSVKKGWSLIRSEFGYIVGGNVKDESNVICVCSFGYDD